MIQRSPKKNHRPPDNGQMPNSSGRLYTNTGGVDLQEYSQPVFDQASVASCDGVGSDETLVLKLYFAKSIVINRQPMTIDPSAIANITT
jgi:hypothetical protein